MKNLFFILLFIFSTSSWSKFIGEDKDYLLMKVKEKLRKYNPRQIDISHGESPRKLVKNLLLYFNGYYEVSFISGLDGLKYDCDLNHGHSSYGVALSGNAEIYIMNCKNENDSTFFPTHLERIFREQQPDRASDDPIKFRRWNLANTALTIGLIDHWYYTVEYTSLAQKRIKCTAFLEYEKTWDKSMVDQRMQIYNCKQIDFPKITSSNDILHKFNFDCIDSNILNWTELKGNLKFTDSLYDFYSDDLDKKWPLPKESEVNCQENDISYWKNFSKKMISLDKVKMKTKKVTPFNYGAGALNRFATLETEKLEKIVLENALISQAYNRLFLKFREKNQNSNYLQWISIASHSSPVVGRSIRKAYSNRVSEDFLNANAGLRSIHEQDIKKSHHTNSITNFFEKRTDVAKMVGEGNKNVFDDMFWQNFAATYCGPKKVVELNNALAQKYQQEGDRKLSKHHEQLSNSWNLIFNGINKSPVDKEQVQLGNLQLLRIEQSNILQEQMYGGYEPKVVNKLGIFNSLAKAKFYDTNGEKLQTFDEFSLEVKQENDLSDLNSRYRWMEYIATEQINYINSSEQVGALKLLYTAPLYESYLILNDYK